MTGREKIKNALEYKEGPIPLDLGGTCCSGIHISIVEKLREYYGLEKHPLKTAEVMQMIGVIEDDLKVAMGIDTVEILHADCAFGMHNDKVKEWITPWGQTVLMPSDFEYSEDNENVYVYPCSDRMVPPSGRMSKASFFFDPIVRQPHFDEDNLNPEDNLEEYGYISDQPFNYVTQQINQYKEEEYSLLSSIGGSNIAEVMVSSVALKDPKGIRQVEEWYMSMLLRPDYMHKVFEAQTEILLKNLEVYKKLFRDNIDAVYLCGTDYGTQNAPFCSNEMFKRLYKPYYKRINDWIHLNTKWKTIKHCCGAIEPLIKEFIECGFDILNPIQWTAAGMDRKALKRNYGRDIVFLGGGANTQKTLPFGSSNEVYKETIEICKDLSPGGGFIFSAIHNIQAKTPVENVVAMINAFHSFNNG